MKKIWNKIASIQWESVVFLVLFFWLGYFAFGYINNTNTQKKSLGNNDLDLLWTVWDVMEEKYPFEQPSFDEKIYGAISGLVDAYGDHYSRFMPPAEMEYFEQTISGEFGGIGAEIGIRDGFLTIITPLKDSPAETMGLEPFDIITHIDGEDISGYSLDGAISKIRGIPGTEVTLGIVRRGEQNILDISIPREIVTIQSLETKSIDDVFIIHLYNFNDDSERQFQQALADFKASGKEKLLLDLRNNPGGYLGAVIDMASYFIPQGLPVVREEFGPGHETIYRSKGYELLNGYNYHIAVLVNRGSASASEIFAGALRDHLDAPILGEVTYGKGSVQELISLPQNTALKVTIAHWLTPNGDYISDNGIEPDMVIEFEREGENDLQLLRALEIFN